MASDDLRAWIRRACAEADGFNFEGLEPYDYQRHADAVLAIVQAKVAALEKELGDWRTAAYKASHDRDQAHIVCRSAALLLRAVADRGTDVGALLAAADDLDNVAGPAAPQRCCVCQTAEHGGAAFYENHRGQLFCWPCADGDRPTTTKETQS